MAKLNQIIAIEKGQKSLNYSKIDALQKLVQKPELFNGHIRNYQHLDDEAAASERLPPEPKKVQLKTKDVLNELEKLTTEMFDISARKEWTNSQARADLKVDDRIIISNVPVTYLLFLEKQLTDLRTFIESITVLDASEDWQKDNADGLYKTRGTQSNRTKKLQRAIVLYAATDKHPAQTQLITDDIVVGHWHTVRHSGAMPSTDKKEMSERITKLLQAVKQAREAANSVDEVGKVQVGKHIFDYVFGR